MIAPTTSRRLGACVAAIGSIVTSITLLTSLQGGGVIALSAASCPPGPVPAVTGHPQPTATPATPSASPSASPTPLNTPAPSPSAAPPTPTAGSLSPTPTPGALAPTPTPKPASGGATKPAATSPTPAVATGVSGSAGPPPAPKPPARSTPLPRPAVSAGSPRPSAGPVAAGDCVPAGTPTPPPVRATPPLPTATTPPTPALTPHPRPTPTPSGPPSGSRTAPPPVSHPVRSVLPGFISGSVPRSLLDTIAKANSHRPLIHFHPPTAAQTPTAPASVSELRPSSAPLHVTPAQSGPDPVPMLVLAAMVLLALVIREVVLLLVLAKTRLKDRQGAFRPSRSTVVGVGGVMLAVVAVGVQSMTQPPRVVTPGQTSSQPSSRAGDHGPTSMVQLPGHNMQAPPPHRAGSAWPTAPIWLTLVAVETAIESSSTQAGIPLTLSGVQDRTGRDAALAREEAVYEQAVADPATAASLLDAATQTGDPEAISAVTSDLAIVRLTRAEVAAASDAKQALARLGAFSTAQLDALAAGTPLISPMVGSISQGFGPSPYAMEPAHTFDGVWYSHFHTGVDIAASQGTPVHAAADGVVLVAGASTDGDGHFVGFGQYVVIQHPDGFTTLYGHLLDMTVHPGDQVPQGQVIGHEGSTGNSTGPHLHFEIRIDGEPVDPLPYIAGSR